MIERCLLRCRRHVFGALIAVGVVAPFALYGQGPGQGGSPQAAQAHAPVDITGYWVSVVTEDWRWRMVTPRRGDYPSVPLTQAGKDLADAWDPAKDTAAGEQCKAYGAPGVMRLPTRLHITWQSPDTLKVEADNGTQTRLFHFMGPQAFVLESEGAPVPGLPVIAPSWQGESLAEWEFAGEPARGGESKGMGGDLKVITRNMRPGYLQKNGVPYSGNAVLTEYFNRMDEPSGVSWLLDVATVVDPEYLRARFIRSTHYKREADGSKWDPSPCEAM